MTASENQIVVYQPNETVRLDVRLENETVWLTQEQMALLFGRDQSVIARHVGNIFKEGELDRNSVYAKMHILPVTARRTRSHSITLMLSIGASLKDLGHKCFAFTKLDAGEIRRIKSAAFASRAR